MTHQINITRIKVISKLLKSINKDVVFVGGATVSLYSDSKGGDVRPTDDVDVVIELATYNSFSLLEAELRRAGFENDIDSGIVCRYRVQGIVVDIMPTKPEVVGFSNKWYADGFQNSETIMLDEESIRIFSLPYFIATKLEAFKNRGENDFRFSTDFEDIVYVLENNTRIEQYFQALPKKLQSYFKHTFNELLNHPEWEEGLYAHLEPRNAPQQIVKIEKFLREVINQ